MALRQHAPAIDVAAKQTLIRRIAGLCAGLMVATIVLSAYMRLWQSGLGCSDWPACYGQNLRDAAAGMASPGSHGVALARLAHRIVASLVLVLALMLVMTTLTSRPRLRREGRLSLALLLLALALAALGIVTAGATLPVVTLGNLVGGFVMLALCARLAAAPRPLRTTAGSGLARWVWPALALLLTQVALGALISGSYAALSCSGWADCVQTAAAAGWDWQALNPWSAPTLDARPPFNAAGALVQLAHRLGAALLLPLLMAVIGMAWRSGRRREALALALMLALQGLLGWSMVAAGLPMSGVLLHNLNAALMLAVLVRLA